MTSVMVIGLEIGLVSFYVYSQRRNVVHTKTLEWELEDDDIVETSYDL